MASTCLAVGKGAADWRTSTMILLVFLIAPLAHARDGVIEISQTAATAGGVTPGDTAGFPVTLSVPGSYVLTSSLTVSATNVDAISATVAGVEIDLNGFTIQGPVACTGYGAGVSCTPSVGAGAAISGQDQLIVSGGFLKGFLYGVLSGNDCAIEDVIAKDHFSHGFVVGARCRLVHTITSRNGGNGIDTDEGCLARENVAIGNKGAGIRFRAPAGTAVGNIARGNGSIGLRAGAGSVVQGNSATDNGGDGIQTVTGSIVDGNIASDNLGYQMSLGSNAGFTNNAVSVRIGSPGTVSGGVFIAPNSCNSGQAETDCRYQP